MPSTVAKNLARSRQTVTVAGDIMAGQVKNLSGESQQQSRNRFSSVIGRSTLPAYSVFVSMSNTKHRHRSGRM